jgi:hypothetical protein
VIVKDFVDKIKQELNQQATLNFILIHDDGSWELVDLLDVSMNQDVIERDNNKAALVFHTRKDNIKNFNT